MNKQEKISIRKIPLGTLAITLCLGIYLSGCGKKEDESGKPSNATLVSTTMANVTKLEILEESVGTLEGLIDPTISAEVAARVLKVLVRPGETVKKGQVLVLLDGTDISLQQREAEAEAARVEALLVNQNQIVERNQKLVQQNFISKNALDDTTTQQAALKKQLDGVRAKIASIAHTGTKTRVVAPVDGIVQQQVVSGGDYVKVGDPLLQIISKQRLRAHLPFPERVASRIRPGLKVRLMTPATDNEVISEVREMKPLIGTSNRAIDVLADVTGQEGWQAGASVNGVVVIGEVEAVVLPEQSVVLRPAGDVVYVIRDNRAEQRVVKTGLRQEGKVEIIEGVGAGEVVAVDGAAFLTDQAEVTIRNAASGQDKAGA